MTRTVAVRQRVDYSILFLGSFLDQLISRLAKRTQYIALQGLAKYLVVLIETVPWPAVRDRW